MDSKPRQSRSRELISVARDQHGLLTAADLRSMRLVGRSRTELLRSGQLVPVHRGVYRSASHPVTFEQRCAAACLAAPDAAVVGSDMADPIVGFGIEVDHVTWHGGRPETQRDKRRDKRRDLALTRLGWTIGRVTDDDIEQRIAVTVDQLVAIADHCARRAG